MASQQDLFAAFSYKHCFPALTRPLRQSADSRPMTPTKPEPTPSNTPDQPAAGKGKPAKTPMDQRSQPGQQQDFRDESVKTSLELPHDRDQAQDMTSPQPDPLIEQAAKDIANGLKDTSKALETDRTYKKL